MTLRDELGYKCERGRASPLPRPSSRRQRVIVVPDDSRRLRGSVLMTPEEGGDVAVFTSGAPTTSRAGPSHRRAKVAINIRAHARFSDGVFSACPLKLVSVWGTGTDNIDLNAAGMRVSPV